MNGEKNNNLTRIGVFYDGNYFLHVSNYYNYMHERKSRLSISGLHHFIKNEVAQQEGTDGRLCHIVDAHYFRGRLNAREASNLGNALYNDRVFDDILSSEGVTTHYLPIKTDKYGKWQEKGIDVWLALEAFELAFYKRFHVLVLVASDGDYVPLIRKLNTLGTRVMVLSWDFKYTNENGKEMITRTSQDLLEEVTYPIAMHEIIDNRVKKNDPLINGLFVPKSPSKLFKKQHVTVPHVERNIQKGKTKPNASTQSLKKISTIKKLKDGYGFIENGSKDLFFFHGDLIEYDFNDLVEGDKVEFEEGIVDDGSERGIAKNIRVIE